MRWNPVLFYWERFPGSLIVGASWYRGMDRTGVETKNIVIHLGLRAVRIERGIMVVK